MKTPTSRTRSRLIARAFAAAAALALTFSSGTTQGGLWEVNAPKTFDLPAVAVVRVRVENEELPGHASIYFPHLAQWLQTNAKGEIPLPAPYPGDERPIRVIPADPAAYGSEFARIYPVRDGVVNLRSLSVTKSILTKADDLAKQGQFAEAAAGYALAATRTSMAAEFTPLRRTAFELLAKQFGGGFVPEGYDFRANAELIAAINSKRGADAAPASGRLSATSFRDIAGLKTVTIFVADAQRQHLQSRK